jgi:transposase
LWQTEFDDATITATATRLKCLQPKLVVMQATGTYELPVAGMFATVGVPFAIVNPRNVREFARAVGRICRSDFTQAGLLAYFGELVDPEPRPLPADLIAKLMHLRTRREDVSQMLALEKGRLKSATDVLRKDMQRHITFLEQSIATLNHEFGRIVRSSVAWR